ncbi:MAG: flagellar hook-associated protein FlgK [Armatimonadota bacterium]
MSTFSTIQVALSGLITQQRAIDVTSHNVVNANTPGYHRQEAVINTLPAIPQPGSRNGAAKGQFGTGVEVSYVRRMQDVYTQQQLRATQQEVGRWTAMTGGLERIETFLAPGQKLDLSSMLDQFFGAWQLLATHPEDLSSRLTVRSAGVNLANTLNNTADQLNYLKAQIASDLQGKVDRVNALADNLAQLNTQIGMARADGNSPNDFLDQRDQVLQELAGLIGANELGTESWTGITSAGGRPLVEGSKSFQISLQATPTGTQLIWDDGSAVSGIGGEVAALIELRDTTIPRYMAQLDTVAAGLAGAVNALHATGVTQDNQPAGDFFTGNTAGSIHVADAIVTDAGAIASTTQADAPGDGSLATDIFNLITQPLIGTQTLNQAAQALLSNIGNDVQTARTNTRTQSALHDLITARDQQTGGVSLDEEMANLLIYQRAYQASARVLVAADEMIQVLLQQLG